MAGDSNMDDFRSIYDRAELDADNLGGPDCPDLDFVYGDSDSHLNEVAELYSYTEQSEFQQNVKAFEEQMEVYHIQPQWQKLTVAERRGVILKLMNELDLSQRTLRMKAARCILYLAQGCFAEVQSDQEQQSWTRTNVMMLYELGIFATFVEMLSFEIENTNSAEVAIRKVTVSLADSVDLRIVLSVLYIVTEVMRAEQSADGEFQENVDNFIAELNQPFGDELLTVKLLGMITRFCSGSAPHFPMKKVLLLLWKISLVGLGGMQTLRELKDKYRAEHRLSPTKEDTLEIARQMRASSPPANTADILENQMPKRNRPFRRVRTNEQILQEPKRSINHSVALQSTPCPNPQQSLMKQSSLDEQEQLGMEMDAQQAENEDENGDYFRPYDPNLNSNAPGPGGQKEQLSPVIPMRLIDRLPWTPKVRQKDIDQFLDASRTKFIGFTLPEDHQSLAGLPTSIHEGFRTLNRHMYVSLADIQVKKEEEIARNPLLYLDGEVTMTPAEQLYQAIQPNLPQYMIALLKILLAAAPTSKAKTESINIMADVLPEEMPMTVTQSTKLGIDVNRHKEIIVKAVSGILLLYLKHFKINHIYQFEFMSQHLVFANCIPLVLKFFNQHILTYIGSKNSIPIIDFPACILSETPELTADSLVIGDSAAYSWRNVYSCINLLRILNKLTKWKHSRIMMLVVFKSAPILKRTLRVRHAMMQLYVLKLLKMQTKYLGRQWRKTNMKIISSIYSKVRHRLNDDWAFGNDLDARPWDFQAEECTLRACVDRFNNRRYQSGNSGSILRTATGNGSGGLQSGNNNGGGPVISDLNEYDAANAVDGNGGQLGGSANSDRVANGQGNGGWDVDGVELTEEFKQNYEEWLQQEVFNHQINWDSLITYNEF